MNDETRERLSALMDGELAEAHARRTFDEALDSNELRATWERYHLIRDVVRERIAPVSLGDRVRTEVEAEPVLLATRRRPRLVRPLPLAMAASLLIAVVTGAFIGASWRSDAPPEQIAAVPPTTAPKVDAPPLVWNVEPTVARRLNNYLVNHNERGGMPGMHPYARIVSYEQQRFQ